MASRKHPRKRPGVHYRIRLGSPQDRENLTVNTVKMTVLRETRDEHGAVIGRPTKVRDPMIVTAWTKRKAMQRAENRAYEIIAEDQRARGVRVTPREEYRRRG